MKKESFATGAIYTLISSIAMGFIGLLGKLGSETLFIPALLFWRYLAAFLLCLIGMWIIGRLRKLRENLSFSNLKMNFFRSFFILGAQGCFYYYLQTNTLFNGMALLNTGPLFIPLIEWGILRKKVGKSSWISLVICFIGVLCILQPDAQIFVYSSFIGLAAGLFQGISQILFGRTSRETRPDLGILLLMLSCLVLSAFIYLLSDTTWQPGENGSQWIFWLIFSLGIFTLVNQFTRAGAYQHATPSRVSVFLYFSVLLAGVFDWLVFHNIPNILSVIGVILVVGGGILKIYLRNIFLKKQ